MDAHRPLTPKDDLAHILTWQESRSLSKNITLQFQHTVYQIQTHRPTYALRNAKVMVCVNALDEISIWHNGKSLPFSLFQPQSQQSQIVLSKDLDHTLTLRTPTKPAPDHPRRAWRGHSYFAKYVTFLLGANRGIGIFQYVNWQPRPRFAFLLVKEWYI